MSLRNKTIIVKKVRKKIVKTTETSPQAGTIGETQSNLQCKETENLNELKTNNTLHLRDGAAKPADLVEPSAEPVHPGEERSPAGAAATPEHALRRKRRRKRRPPWSAARCHCAADPSPGARPRRPRPLRRSRHRRTEPSPPLPPLATTRARVSGKNGFLGLNKTHPDEPRGKMGGAVEAGGDFFFVGLAG
jgi:hypothetical protein